MARKSSKKYLKEANAQIILFVLIMIIMRIVVLNFMSEISGIEFDELSKARIYNMMKTVFGFGMDYTL